MGLGWRQYFLAGLLALALHVAVATVLLWRAAPPEGAAVAAGTGGIEIALGPAGRATGSPESVDEVETGAVEPEATSEDVPESDSLPEPELLPEPEPLPEPEALREPEPLPEPELLAEPALPSGPEPIQEPRAEGSPNPAAQAALSGAAGLDGPRDSDATGSGDATAGGGLPGESRDYVATVLAWLERHKQYPRRARLRRQEGTAMLYFVVDRSGTVLEYRLERSSSHPALDDEVLAMIERAQPLPPMPQHMGRERLELIVPVEFFLR